MTSAGWFTFEKKVGVIAPRAGVDVRGKKGRLAEGEGQAKGPWITSDENSERIDPAFLNASMTSRPVIHGRRVTPR